VIFYFQAQSKLHSSNPLASSNLMEVETPADSTKRAADIKKALTIFVLGASGTSLQSFPSFRDGAAEKSDSSENFQDRSRPPVHAIFSPRRFGSCPFRFSGSNRRRVWFLI
jgi:hypothetical protein